MFYLFLLAHLVLSLLGAPERCRAMGAAGRQDVTAHWSWQLAAHRLRAVYGSLMAEKAPS